MTDPDMSQTNADTAATTARKSVLMRGLMMLLTAMLIWMATSVLGLLTLLQFVLMLLDKGTPNAQIAKFGETVGKWLAKAALFQTAKSDDKPWPFSSLD
jgi:hypothetical protein